MTKGQCVGTSTVTDYKNVLPKSLDPSGVGQGARLRMTESRGKRYLIMTRIKKRLCADNRLIDGFLGVIDIK